MGLLKWRDNPKGLETYLRLFMKVDGEEIVKVKYLTGEPVSSVIVFCSYSKCSIVGPAAYFYLS